MKKHLFTLLIIVSYGALTEETDKAAFTEEDTLSQEQLDQLDRDKFLHRMNKYFGTVVSSSPYPGVRATYEGTELMSQLSSVNQDLQLLLQQKSMDQFMDQEHINTARYPRLYISGAVEATGFVQKDVSGKARSDMELTDVELDFFSILNKYSKCFFSVTYNRDLVNISNNRVNNSRLQINSAYALIGNLNKTPFYGTFGQVYVPFGQYTSYYSVSNPLTKILFRTLAPEIAVGSYYKGLIASVFAYKGASYVGSHHNLNNYGFNFGFEFNYKKLDGKLAVSMQRNVADSLGMQEAFGDTRSSEKLRHVVPGFDINGFFTYGESLRFIFEYIDSLRAFSPFDMAFSKDGNYFRGAQPSALNIEGAYTFNIKKYPAKFALGYSESWQALGFNVPKRRFNSVFGLYIFSSTLLSFEYTLDMLYSSSCRAGGKFVRNASNEPAYFVNPSHLGQHQQTFSIDLYIYF